jgi:putative membrane protein
MNNFMPSLRTGLVAVCFAAASSFALANDMDAEDFVDEASAMGLAEVHNATLALTKATSQDVKDFAQRMLDDHSAANQQLSQVASGKEDLELADEATLMAKAKALILQLRSGESFDQAYANNQVVAHEKSVELYEGAAKGVEDADLKAFASEQLPTLREHLEMARQLAAKHGGDAANDE